MCSPDPVLGAVTAALCELVPRATPGSVTVRVTAAEPPATVRTDPDGVTSVWEGGVGAVARLVAARLYGAEQLAAARPPASPLQQAEQAKRHRDIGGEIGALMAGDQALREAAWYPAQAGDLLIVHLPETVRMPATGDTYVVVKDNVGDLVLQHLQYSGPPEPGGGWYAPGMADEPFYEAWFEAGPHRLVIIRDGRVVHDGPAAAAAAGR